LESCGDPLTVTGHGTKPENERKSKSNNVTKLTTSPVL
jgi:hypothetical protein